MALIIEQEWSKVETQTSWSIMPCLSYQDNNIEVPENPNSNSDNQCIKSNALGDVYKHVYRSCWITKASCWITKATCRSMQF